MGFFEDQYDEPDPRPIQPKEKHWVDYRVEEMEEKAGVNKLPENGPVECLQRDDAYLFSSCERLWKFMLNMPH